MIISIVFILAARQRDRDSWTRSFHVTGHSPNVCSTGQDRARLEPGTQVHSGVFVGGKDQIPGPSLFLPRCANTGSLNWKWSQNSNSGTQTRVLAFQAA